ncbi:MAG: hypothetical protein M5R36_03005 [Deltaproteobacteria bacterium]|nr:hypothetical protein [Deltaproteobacteria bacterium]
MIAIPPFARRKLAERGHRFGPKTRGEFRRFVRERRRDHRFHFVDRPVVRPQIERRQNIGEIKIAERADRGRRDIGFAQVGRRDEQRVGGGGIVRSTEGRQRPAADLPRLARRGVWIEFPGRCASVFHRENRSQHLGFSLREGG